MKKIILGIFIFTLLFIIPSFALDLPVLMYHSISNEEGIYYTTEEKLESDIKSLKEAGYTTVSFKEVIDYVYNGGKLPEKSVVITFDDGYESMHSVVLPMAKRLDFKFSVFTTAGFVDFGGMSWSQVKDIHLSHEGEIGCHTFNLHGRGITRGGYQNFREWENSLRYDNSLARYLFGGNMGYNPLIYAYPFGKYSEETEEILREEGYMVTVTTEAGINEIERGNFEDLYLMLRIPMDGQKKSATYLIEKYKNVKRNEKIEKIRENVFKIRKVSRKEALTALYRESFKGDVFKPDVISGYIDLSYEDEATRQLFAKCVKNNIISGYSDYTIRPYNYITRGEFALLLARRTGYDGRAGNAAFYDTAKWNAGAISYCYKKGYMNGMGNGYFGANEILTKDQLSLILKRAKIN